MGQSGGKSVFFIVLSAAATTGLAASAVTAWLPDWVIVPLTALAAAGVSAGLIRWRILSPLQSLLGDLRDNLLGSSVFFDGAPENDSDRDADTRDPMLCAIDRLRYMAEQMADHGNRIAIAAAEVSSAAGHLESDAPQAGAITTTVKRMEGAMNAMAQSAAQAAVCAERAGEAGTSGRSRLSDTDQPVLVQREQIKAAADQLAGLCDRTGRLDNALAAIGELAEQTGLMAVNAAGEAARAGEPGRGFATLANEVRGLVQQTTAATQEIIGMVAEMDAEASAAATSVAELSRVVDEGIRFNDELDEQLAAVQSHATTARERMQAIAEGASANWNELAQLGSTLQHSDPQPQLSHSQVRIVAHQAAQLANTAETIHGQVVTLGGQSRHAHMRFIAQSVAQSIGQAFEQGIDDERINDSILFDGDCAQNQDRTGKTMTFDAFAEQVLPAIEEPVIELNPELGYLGAVNRDGHFHSLHRRHTKQSMQESAGNETGDAAVDATVAKRCSDSTEPFLLQTYKDGDGNVMHDISSPIHVNGRHWGAFHMGYQADAEQV